ncbi:ABC transporter substrate-binding protein [Microvirga pudoricolor]|uniref:ABC transporter substrate-binding protein n=1 Tax=Microvirga pudoricolor TaxID=2778729 RepID=UPI001951ADFA|nr:ABC transporter substrate-binding protein [Microvirga pudoricolor]MBM6595226.1 ABC transporter substrate-binding protein [Microvirga pudoricolor]
MWNHQLRAALAGLAVAASFSTSASAESVLRVAMTAGDVPITIGHPDQGFEGYRFVGYNLYDSLIAWDLSSADKPSGIVPGLATSWEVDPANKNRWILKLREGVRWHDGAPFTADDVVWNFEHLLDSKVPHYHAAQAASVKARIISIKNVEKVDDMTIAINTTDPTALLPYQLAYVLLVSPHRYKEVKGDWDAFGKNPSGTGPYLFSKLVPRERIELVKNTNYWDPKRIPKHDRLVAMPMPEATTRSAALLSGQVDWIEAPLPDTIPRLEKAGMKIVSNAYPHIWSWELSYQPGNPWSDVRVRKAANLAVDRAGMKEMLGGLMIESTGNVEPDHPWYGKPAFQIKTDKEAALKLMKEAGYGPGKPVKVKMAISTAGSGQMQPLPMNEFVQENLRDIGINVEFEVMDWNALIETQRKGVKAPETMQAGINGINFSRNTQEPFGAICRFAQTDQASPKGANWGHYSNPEIDAVCAKAVVEFDPEKQASLFAEAHQKMVDDALMIWIAHDVNPRAMSPKVKGFVQSKNWFQDLTPVTVAP